MKFEPYQGKEDDLQKTLMRYVRMQYPERDYLYCHVPNGGSRSHKSGALMKALGLRPGMPDLMFFTSRPRPGLKSARYNGLAIELKVGKNKKTASQMTVHALLMAQGWLVHTTYSLDEAIYLIDQYMKP